jgi:two-component system, OmpR family, sensor histidine kinase BaeS
VSDPTPPEPNPAPSQGAPSRPPNPENRPPWWPEGEAWPPERWGPPWWGGPGMRGRRGRRGGPWRGPRRGLARHFGCLMVLLSLLIVSVGVLVLWLLSTLLGLGGGGGEFATLARGAGLVVLVVGVVAVAVAIRLVRSIAPPLGDLVDAAGRVEGGDYAVRVPEVQRGPGELRGLGRAFNTMTARLEADEAQRRRLLADVSHELRTPLAVVQGNLEALIDGVYPADEAHLGPILEETRVIERLIGDLRTLSLAEAGTLALHPESTDIGVLIAEVIDGFRPRAKARGVEIRLEASNELPLVELDPIRIREVVSNLVDNALRYAGAGGLISLTARELPAGTTTAVDAAPATLEIVVTDDGPGIAPELVPTVFDRFAKTAESRGSGLGLAIARAIVEAHGGTISAASTPGTGTTMRVSLPLR